MTRQETMLTPELAGLLLSRSNPRQRQVSRQIAENYARAMREGRWTLVDDPILVVGASHASETDPEGSMFNGGHRCKAVVISGSSVPVYIDWDADPKTFDIIDVGFKRSASQFVSNEYASRRAAAARLILWYERRFERPPTGVNLSFDLHEVLASVSQHELALTAVMSMANQTVEYTGLAASVVTAAFTIAWETGYGRDLGDFVDGIVDPSFLAEDEAPRLLADRFRRQSNRSRRRKTSEDWTLLVRAMNLHFERKLAKRLVLSDVWPRVGETDREYRRRSNVLSAARSRQKDRVLSDSRAAS